MKFTGTTRYAWDEYVALVAPVYAATKSPRQAAESASLFADEMCKQRSMRFDLKDKKKDE